MTQLLSGENKPATKRSFGFARRYASEPRCVNPDPVSSTAKNGARPTCDRLVVRFVRFALEELMGSADEVTVELVPQATDDVRALISELDGILSAEYTPVQRHGLAFDAIFTPDIRFFLARLSGLAVGCGGVAFFADFAEVKRMYVRDVARGRGVAQAVLARIEGEARDAGFALLKLETGVRQRAGLTRPSFGFAAATKSALSAAKPASANEVNWAATSCTLRRPFGSYHL
jgi:putative acetyltransferase